MEQQTNSSRGCLVLSPCRSVSLLSAGGTRVSASLELARWKQKRRARSVSARSAHLGRSRLRQFEPQREGEKEREIKCVRVRVCV